MALPSLQIGMIVALGAAVVLANVAQPYPSIAPLHHAPTLLLVLAAPALLRRWPLSNGAVACVGLFFLLHTLGGRYTYSNLPYDLWSSRLTGVAISELLGATRNHYDRFVHFAFGLLATLPITEALRRHAGLAKGVALFSAINVVLAIGALYEIVEWLLTLTAPPAMADDYNGQQGDPWDAQKDMALAGVGALLATIVLKFSHRLRR